MVDPGKAEGITGSWRIIEMAAAANKAWNAHSWSSALNTAVLPCAAMRAPAELPHRE